jgi:hypothetical protein
LDEVDPDVDIFMKMIRQVWDGSLRASGYLSELQAVLWTIDDFPEMAINEVAETMLELVNIQQDPGWLELVTDILHRADDSVFVHQAMPYLDLICSFLPNEYSLRLVRRAVVLFTEPRYDLARRLCETLWDRDQICYVLVCIRDFVRAHAAEPIKDELRAFIARVPPAPRLSMVVVEIAAAIGDFETVNSRLRSSLTREAAPSDLLESVFRVDPSRLGEDERGEFEDAILDRLADHPRFVPVYLETLWRAETLRSRLEGEGKRSERLRALCVLAVGGPFGVRCEVVRWLWLSWPCCEAGERARLRELAGFAELEEILLENELPAGLEEAIRAALTEVGEVDAESH